MRLSPGQFGALKRFFLANSEATFAYLFYDGSVRGDMGIYGHSRTGQVVCIALEGIPMLVYRKAFFGKRGEP